MPGASYRILGFTLNGPPPLGRVHIEWEDGVHLLYGRNGAGKSTLLRGLRECLAGEHSAGGALMHIELGAPDGSFLAQLLGFERYGPSAWNWEPYLDESFAKRGGQGWDGYFKVSRQTIDLDALERNAGRAVSNTVLRTRSVLPPFDWSPPSTRPIRLTFSLEPIGDGWRVWWGPPASELMKSDQSLATAADLMEFWEDEDARVLEIASGHQPSWWFDVEEAVEPSVDDGDDGTPEERGRTAQAHEGSASLRFAQLAQGMPGWVPVPLTRLGVLGRSYGPVVITVGDEDAEVVTRNLMMSGVEDGVPASFEAVLDGDVAKLSTTPGLFDMLSDISSHASQALTNLLVEPLAVRVRMLNPVSWLNGDVVVWEAEDVSGSWVRLNQLSAAQRRWAEAAIVWTLNYPLDVSYFVDRSTPLCIIVDEPELALHPVAVAHLADGLLILSRRTDRQSAVFAATHAPQVLSLGGATLHHVLRDGSGRTGIRSLSGDLRGDVDSVASQLGMKPVDLVHLTRLFLVVEGAHDRGALEAWFGDELSEMGMRILLMGGAMEAASIAEAQLLLDFTSAHLVLVLDNSRVSGLAEVWRTAQELAMDDSHAAHAEMRRFEGRANALTPEEGWAIKYCRAAIGTRPDRLHFFGLSLPDMLDYLGPSSFVEGASSWADLRLEHAQFLSQTGRSLHFKMWLRKYKGAKISESAVRRAASAMDHPPSELKGLITWCADLLDGSAGLAPPGDR